MAAVGEAGNAKNQALLDEINALKAEYALLKEEIGLWKQENKLTSATDVEQCRCQRDRGKDCTATTSVSSVKATSKEDFRKLFSLSAAFLESWNSEQPLPSNIASWVEMDVQIFSKDYYLMIGISLPLDEDSGLLFDNESFHGWGMEEVLCAGRSLGYWHGGNKITKSPFSNVIL